MTNGWTAGSDRGQSEVIGYAILFAASLVALTVVVLFGVTALQQVQQSTIADNGQFAMQAVESDVEALYHGGASTRRTEIELTSASLETGPQTEVAVHTNFSGGVNESTFGPYAYQPIVYSSTEADFAFDNSLLIRDQTRGQVAISDSLFVVSGEQAMVPIIQTVPTQSQSVGGSGAATVDASVARTTGRSVTNRSTYVNVTITIDSVPDHARVWNETLSGPVENLPTRVGAPDPFCDRTGGEVKCYFQTSSVTVSRVEIAYNLQ